MVYLKFMLTIVVRMEAKMNTNQEEKETKRRWKAVQERMEAVITSGHKEVKATVTDGQERMEAAINCVVQIRKDHKKLRGHPGAC